MIVLDTSVIIDLVMGKIRENEILDIFENEACAISSISINELLVCANEKQFTILSEFFKSLHVLPFDSEAAYKSVEIEKNLIKKGKIIGKLDIFISSTCLVHNLSLLTFDKDFKNVDGLKLVCA